MTNMGKPEPGQVWARQGKARRLHRRVTAVVDLGHNAYRVEYVDQSGNARKCWCTTWEGWVRHASLTAVLL